MLKRIDHLGIAVRSIEERLGFWSDALALGEAQREEVAGEEVRVAMLRVGESRIELLEPTSQESVIAGFLDRRGEGLHHVCFAVADIEAALAALAAGGCRLVGEAPRTGAGGWRVAFVHPRSSGGVLIELRQDAPRSARRAGPGAIVILCLRDPPEKYWGRITALDAVGVHLHGMIRASVEVWARELQAGGEIHLGTTDLFFPLWRVEKIYVDEDIGPAQSERSAFRAIVGRDVDELL